MGQAPHALYVRASHCRAAYHKLAESHQETLSETAGTRSEPRLSPGHWTARLPSKMPRRLCWRHSCYENLENNHRSLCSLDLGNRFFEAEALLNLANPMDDQQFRALEVLTTRYPRQSPCGRSAHKQYYSNYVLMCVSVVRDVNLRTCAMVGVNHLTISWPSVGDRATPLTLVGVQSFEPDHRCRTVSYRPVRPRDSGMCLL